MKTPLQLSLLSLALLLTACASVSTTTSVSKQNKTGKVATPAVAAPATVTPAVAPNLAPAQQTCDMLKGQFQAQLPFQVLNLMQWKTIAVTDPTQPTGPMFPACQLDFNSDGLTIQKYGLTPSFVSATLERLDWQPGPSNYTADSATGHQESMINTNQLAIINYTFAPPAGACPSNQPLAACKLSKKKWNYQLRMLVLTKPEAPVAVQK